MAPTSHLLAFGGVAGVVIARTLRRALQRGEAHGRPYLVFLGVQAVRRRRALAEAVAGRVKSLSPLEAVRDGATVGATVGATNPRTIAVMVALLPQVSVPSAGHLPEQLLFVCMLFPLIALVLDSAWAFGAGTVGAWLSRSPRRLGRIGGVGGLAMIGIGLGLALAGRRD